MIKIKIIVNREENKQLSVYVINVEAELKRFVRNKDN